MMYGQMTVGSWLHRHRASWSACETFAMHGRPAFGGDGTITVTAGLGGMWATPALAVTMNDGVCLVVEPIDERVKQKIRGAVGG
jgi:urocanate hydratase